MFSKCVKMMFSISDYSSNNYYLSYKATELSIIDYLGNKLNFDYFSMVINTLTNKCMDEFIKFV